MTRSNGTAPASEVPDLVAGLNRADALVQQDQFDAAKKILVDLLQRRPDFVQPWCMLGYIQTRLDRFDEAVSCYAKAHFLCPLNAAILLDLAKAQKRNNLVEAALISLERCRRMAPDNIEVRLLLCDLYWEEGLLDASIDVLSGILKTHPTHERTLLELLAVLHDMGDSKGTIDLAHKMLALPDTSPACRFEAACKLVGLGVEVDEAHLAHGLEPGAEEQRQLKYKIARASVLSRQARYEEAWSCISDANARLRESGQVTTDLERRRWAFALDYARAVPVEAPAQGSVPRSPQLLYIAGAPRSGKTTIEHLLARNPDVHRSFEMSTIERSIMRFAQVSGLPNTVDPWDMEPFPDDILASVLMDQIAGLAAGKTVSVNTNPSNIYYVGLICRIIPTAKFIFVKRNRNDLAFRIFRKYFGDGNKYSTSLATIHEYLDWYEGMMDIWTERLPSRCMTVTYEDMAEDTPQVLDAVCTFAGLTMDNAGQEIFDDRGCSVPFQPFMTVEST